MYHNNDINMIHDVLNGSIDINSLNNNGQTALILACEYIYMIDENIFQNLIDTHTNLNIQDLDGNTALMSLAEGSCWCTSKNISYKILNIIKLLLHNGINVNMENYKKETALFKCCRYFDDKNGKCHIIKELLKYNANINHQDNHNRSVLIFSISGDSRRLTKLLIDYGINKYLKDRNNITVLHHAINKNKEWAIKLLLNSFRNDFYMFILSYNKSVGKLPKDMLKVIWEYVIECDYPLRY